MTVKLFYKNEFIFEKTQKYLNKMHKDVVANILPHFLDFGTLLNYSLTCKNNHNLVKKHLAKKRKESKIHKLFPDHIIDIFGKEVLIEEAVWIENNKKWIGGTGYIDRVSWDDLDHTISFGVDEFKRPYIFIKLQSYIKEGQHIISFALSKQEYEKIDKSILEEQTKWAIMGTDMQVPTKILNGLIVIFQRYSNSPSFVVGNPGSRFLFSFLRGECYICHRLAADIKTLVKERKFVCGAEVF